MNAEDLSVSRRRYRPLLELGRGGMAKVYLAESLASGVRKLVVLKVLNRELAEEQEMRAAFRREAELSARMNHPNVVQVYEVVEYGTVPVIVMEYLDGVALSRLLSHAQLPLRLHLYVLAQVLAGLHHFHELKDFEGNEFNAVHRDVSPQNVLVLHEGPVKVVDFGIAKVNASPDQHTRTGMIKGKIHYMPPEQLLGETSIDRRADVFAVGVMLWEAIAGRRMWEGASEGKVIRALARGDVPKLRDFAPDVPEDLEHVTERALAVDREQRYPTAEAMQFELEQALHKMEGYVQSRELTDFMLKNFGDRRQFQQRTIERALRSPATTMSGIMECVTPPAVEVERSSSTIEHVGDVLVERIPSSVRSTPSPSSISGTGSGTGLGTVVAPRRSWAGPALLVAAVCMIAGGGVWLARRSPGAPVTAGPAAAAPHSSVKLSVVAHPDTAEILLDGVSLGTGRVERSYPAANDVSKLEVRLAGHITEERSVRLTGDTTLEVTLRAEPTPAAPAPAPAASADEDDRVETRSRAVAGQRRVFAPARAAAKPAAPPAADPTPAPAPAPAATANCNPPFRLSPDGVKIFKPECF